MSILVSTLSISPEGPTEGIEIPEGHILLVGKARNAAGDYFTAAVFVPYSRDLAPYTTALLQDLKAQAGTPSIIQ